MQLISLGDGIDTQQKGAKLQFGVKALFADIYLDDLRDKTLRGIGTASPSAASPSL